MIVLKAGGYHYLINSELNKTYINFLSATSTFDLLYKIHYINW